MSRLSHMGMDELMKACVPLLVSPSYEFFMELLHRRQDIQMKSLISQTDPSTIYRSQGQIKAYESMLKLDSEIKALR